MIYNARVELKQIYYTPEQAVTAPKVELVPKMALADFIGVFMVFGILIGISLIILAVEFCGRLSNSLKKKNDSNQGRVRVTMQ